MNAAPRRMFIDSLDDWYSIEYGTPRHCPTCGYHTRFPAYFISDHPDEREYGAPPLATYCPNCPPWEEA